MNMTESDIQALLQEGISVAGTLLDTLGHEYNGLKSGDFDGFIAALEHKQKILSVLHKIDTQLVQNKIPQMAASRRISPGSEPAAGDSRQSGLWTTTTLQHWDDFCDLVKQCRHQNSVNGSIIHMCQNHTTTALAILRGQSHTQETGYSPRGNATTTTASTRIATA